MKLAIAHVITAFVSVVLFSLLCAALADGMSVIELKTPQRLRRGPTLSY
eukprot:gene6826-3413_t